MPQDKDKLIKEVIHKYALVSECDLSRSIYLPLILNKIAASEDLMALAALPNTPKGVAKELGIDEKAAIYILNNLYMRGFIVIEDVTRDGPKYCFTTIGMFMDSILFDPRYDQYGDELWNLWKLYWNEEHVHMYQEEALFRVIPVEGVSLSFEDIMDSTQVVPYEFVSKILNGARRIAIQRCACRVKERRCSNPLEACISLNTFAEYVISRDIGREISCAQALEIVRKCEELGMVHQTVNSNTPDVICNCCACCCTFLRAILHYGKTSAATKSRFAPVFDRQVCVACEHHDCVAGCIFGALSVREGKLNVDYSKCWGCGLCTRTCSRGTVKMRVVRDLQYIPVNGAKMFPFEVPQAD